MIYPETTITLAKIDDRIVKIDMASKFIVTYKDIEKDIVYLGIGLYYSYNGTLANSDKDDRTHFWRHKTAEEKKQDNI
jgi:hypothetical protein